MPTGPTPYSGLAQLGAVALVVLLLGAVGLGVAGGMTIEQSPWIGWVLIGAGVGMIGLALAVFAVARLVEKSASSTYRSYSAQLELLEELRRHTRLLTDSNQNASLSDWAKRIVHREREFELLRDMINGAVVRQDTQAAEHLISELEKQPGHEDEARRLRAEMEKATLATHDEKIDAALERVEALGTAGKWQQARAEVERLRKLFPDDERIRDLPHELELRRQEYKRDLLRRYDRAVGVQDMDLAHDLLVELDQYLSSNEVAALRESARGVFKARLLQLGVQFSLAVSERKFAEAIRIGEEVMREFPNSRYAHEISDMLPTLRQRSQTEIKA